MTEPFRDIVQRIIKQRLRMQAEEQAKGNELGARIHIGYIHGMTDALGLYNETVILPTGTRKDNQ